MSDIMQATTSDNNVEEISSDDVDNPSEQEVRKLQSAWARFRTWEAVHFYEYRRNQPRIQFKVLSYNMLAQYLIEWHPYLYTACKPSNLTWKMRAARLFEEIKYLDPAILCLQEVQASHFESFYSKFEKLGYTGVFKQKTSRRQDGCAIYFKQSLFKMIDHLSVEFNQSKLPILNSDNVGVMVKLIPLYHPGSPFVVATTHLLFHPPATDVRLAQMQVLLAEIDRFAYYKNGNKVGHVPIILTGDFNSTPDSAVLRLLDMGYVLASSYRNDTNWKLLEITDNCQHLSVYLNRKLGKDMNAIKIKLHNSENTQSTDESDISIENPDLHNELFNCELLRQSLNLVSVYPRFKCNGEPEATTFHDYWLTVDYIYYSNQSSLTLLGRLKLPTAFESTFLGSLPNDFYGSDHLVLCALFEMSLN